MDAKKSYEAPVLVIFGTVENLTAGYKTSGVPDAWINYITGLDIPGDGNCWDGGCGSPSGS